jgi:NAD(P)-dependent dehydrogenase (short-subunit alcohol dehydrogenase family)
MYAVPDQSGRRFIVTGANSGTGKEATKRIAAAGGTVIMAVRSLERGAAAREEILREVPGADLVVRHLDLAELSSVHAFAQTVLDDGHPLHVLLNNAGVMAPPKRLETKDGFELQFGSNFLAPFALTNLLLPLLLTTPGARVATMTSGTANFGKIRFDNLQSQRRYRPMGTYAQSKLADMLMAMHLGALAAEHGWALLSTMAHPGYTRTNLQSSGANLGREKQKAPIQRTLLPSQAVEQGAEPLLFAAVDPNAQQSAYYGPGGVFGLVGPSKQVRIPRSAKPVGLAAQLWAEAERLTGVATPS